MVLDLERLNKYILINILLTSFLVGVFYPLTMLGYCRFFSGASIWLNVSLVSTLPIENGYLFNEKENASVNIQSVCV